MTFLWQDSPGLQIPKSCKHKKFLDPEIIAGWGIPSFINIEEQDGSAKEKSVYCDIDDLGDDNWWQPVEFQHRQRQGAVDCYNLKQYEKQDFLYVSIGNGWFTEKELTGITQKELEKDDVRLKPNETHEKNDTDTPYYNAICPLLHRVAMPQICRGKHRHSIPWLLKFGRKDK